MQRRGRGEANGEYSGTGHHEFDRPVGAVERWGGRRSLHVPIGQSPEVRIGPVEDTVQDGTKCGMGRSAGGEYQQPLGAREGDVVLPGQVERRSPARMDRDVNGARGIFLWALGDSRFLRGLTTQVASQTTLASSNVV